MEDLKLQRDIIGVVISQFEWATELIPKEIKVTTDSRSIYLKEDEYVFRNVFGNMALNEGIHYWEIIADSRSEHELKIGVTGVIDIT